MKRGGIRKDNRGDTLILVIGCIALLSILGIVILTKTLDNQHMKLTEEQAQQTFFEANSSASEMVTALEAAAQEAIERAFYDMMVEYSLSDYSIDREDRFNNVFVANLEKKITDVGLQDLLTEALGAPVSDLTVSYTSVYPDASPTPSPGSTLNNTKVVRIKDAVFSYTVNGSQSKITTDICITAKIPDVEAGFRSGATCDFSDFALITDGLTQVTANGVQSMNLDGNLYIGGALNVGTETDPEGNVEVTNAEKMLIYKDMVIQEGAIVSVTNTEANESGQGVWANGITVNGGSFSSSGTNFYIADDLTLEGADPSVAISGTSSEYIGYSGGGSGLEAHQRSSAITINTIDTSLSLNMENLGKLTLTGSSYILDPAWMSSFGGEAQEVAGILQGESIAYKDMQTMYLVPGTCLSTGRNPVIGDDDISMTTMMYSFTNDASEIESIDLSNYLDTSNPFVIRVARLDGGTTIAKYVYMNFKNEVAAAQYVKDFLETSKGEDVKKRIHNLGAGSSITLPFNFSTKSNAYGYNGSDLTVYPGAATSELSLLTTTSIMARQRYNGLFTGLKIGGGGVVDPTKKMVADRILAEGAFSGMAADASLDSIYVNDPDDPTKKYRFIAVNGDLTIGSGSGYQNVNGIILVNGDVNYATSGASLNGLILATGNVYVSSNTTLTADARAVEQLLTNETVASFFRGYAADGDDGYLSSQAVDISFENWKKND